MAAEIKLTHLPEEDRPRERLLRHGSRGLSEAELLAVLLRTGRPGQSALAMARQVLADHGGLTGLLRADPASLRRRGLGAAKSASVLVAVEIGRRLARARLPDQELMSRPDSVARYLYLRYGDRDQEIMGALYLDVRNRLVAEGDVYRGTLSRAVVEPRAILARALKHGASGIILFHTHPSGDPSPSLEDLEFTRRMAAASEVVGIRLIDHMILGGANSWVSLRRRNAW